MKNILILDGTPIRTGVIVLTYYLCMTLVICLALFLIVEGIIDPFGSLMTWLGSFILVVVPVFVRVFFDMILLLCRKNQQEYKLTYGRKAASMEKTVKQQKFELPS